MISFNKLFQYFVNLKQQNYIQMVNSNFDDILNSFSFDIFTQDNINNQNILKIIERINKFKFIMIDICKKYEDYLFIICFDKIVIVINQIYFEKFSNFFSNKKDSTIYCFSKSAEKAVQAYLSPNDFIFAENASKFYSIEIKSFLKKFHIRLSRNYEGSLDYQSIFDIWEIISPSMAGFLIKKAYESHFLNRNYMMIEKVPEIKKIESDEYIILTPLNSGSSSNISLVYMIQTENLLVLKTPFMTSEMKKISEREKNNYLNINQPFMPHLYGTTEIDSQECLLIEYIQGEALTKINEMKLNNDEKLVVIVDLLIILNYLHQNQFIYRDLKPDNIIIDQNKTAILIDFDRMIKFDTEINKDIMTCDFEEKFTSPEILKGESVSYKSDIYSLGLLICFILSEKNIDKINLLSILCSFPSEFVELQTICNKCIDDDPEGRPTLKEISLFFIYNYFDKLANLYSRDITKFGQFLFLLENNDSSLGEYVLNSIPNIENQLCSSMSKLADKTGDPILANFKGLYEVFGQNNNEGINLLLQQADQNNVLAQLSLGIMYLNGEKVDQDLSKSIHYLTKAADQNDPIAQYYLGEMYLNMVPPNINKSLDYFYRSANNNCPQAQYMLGLIHYKSQFIQRDTKKAIYYLTLSANQNNLEAQIFLGSIYIIDDHERDVSKSITFFKLAANQGSVDAQIALGNIYNSNIYVDRQIDKAIYYYEFAAKQGSAIAQNALGDIYYKSFNVDRQIDKAIYYYKLAANQNNINSLQNLAYIFFFGDNVRRDINKVIEYLTKAADLNDTVSQFILGVFYSTNQIIPINMNKALKYLLLAAENKYPIAYYVLGKIYYYGNNITKNINKAIEYFSHAADQNNVDAQYMLGIIYYQGKYVSRNMEKAIYYFNLASNQNNVESQIILGSIYYDNPYVPKDKARAIHYFTLATRQNHSGSLFFLGYIYFFENRLDKALEYFTLSSNQNNAEAQTMLGYIYYYSEKIPKDAAKAIHYFTLAAKQFRPEALFYLGFIYYADFNFQDFEKAVHLFTLAANKNYSLAFLYLGFIYYEGKIVQFNVKKSIDYFERSSKNTFNKFNVSNYFLGLIYFADIGIPRDMKKVIDYYKKSSSCNIQYAKNNLALIYKYGLGTEKNIYYAIELLKEAIKQKNDIVSMFNLASIYFFDESGKKDVNEAIALLVKALKIQYDFEDCKTFLAIILFDQLQSVTKLNIQSKIKDSKLVNDLYQMIKFLGFENEEAFQFTYNIFKEYSIVYTFPCSIQYINADGKSVSFEEIEKMKPKKHNIKNINDLFYEGFAI